MPDAEETTDDERLGTGTEEKRPTQPDDSVTAPGDDDLDDEGRPRSTFTVEDAYLRPRTQRRSLRQFPSLLRKSLRVALVAGRREFLVAAALQLLAGGGVAVQLLVGKAALQRLLAEGRANSNFGDVVPHLAVLLFVTVLLSFIQAVQSEMSRILSELVSRHARDRILDVAGGVELAAFESPAFFDRLQRAIVNGGSRAYQMVSGLLTILTSVAMVAGITVALVSLHPLLVPFALGAYGPLWFAMTRNSKAFYEFAYRITKIDRQRFYLFRVLTGRDEAKEVRAFQLGRFLRRRYDRLYDQHMAGLRQLARQRVKRAMLGSFGTSGLSVVALGVLGFLYMSGHVSLAAGGAAVAGLLQLSSRLQSFVSGAGSLYEASLFLEDYDSFLALLPEGDTTPAVSPAPEPFAGLRAVDVEFAYPGSTRKALHGVSIDIEPGEVVALVGENGSGKTTLAKLLADLYTPSAGRILWNGRDIRELDPHAVRASIAVIFQDFVRYLMPALDNVAAGRHEWIADTDRVVKAAERADVHRLLSRLPQGYDTMLGKEFEGGRDLSVGQWQRVALARAFFRDAPFVILDEPTSALDPRAESELFTRIRSLLAGRSVLLISHRFSSVRSADRIYVLSGGRVVEEGRHEDLMAEGGLYAELFTLQAAAYLDPQPSPPLP